MTFDWLGQFLFLNPHQRSASSKNSRTRLAHSRRLRLEPLETRALLSVSISGYAVPDIAFHTNNLSATPMVTASPTGDTPAQIRLAYGFNKITFNNGTVAGDGSGTTIAIVDAYDDPNIANDLHQFDLTFGLSDPAFTKVNQNGGTAAPKADSGWASEIALDVEWAHAIAQKAKILLVEASSSSLSDLLTAVNYARNVSGVVAVSMSWGGSDFSGESNYDSYFTTPSGHAGVTFLASSGDSGAPVGFPAISSNVVSVGGTTLNLNSSGNYVSETGWSGSGGGISAYEKQPAYQKGVVTQSTTFRTNPDVSYDANPNTGFSVYDSYQTSAPWGQWGGTSDAAPQWAGLIAIADQGRMLAGKGTLDGATQTLPLLYSIPGSDFHDVTSGTSTGSPRYSAGSGYDLVTGRGSPYADLVVYALAGTGTISTPTATHFSISTPSNTTAGYSFSITVTALDSSNNVISGYLGTVHFTSTDGGAVLPANYTFTSGDKGVHAFTGVKLVLAGNQTVTAVDTATGSIVGNAAISVSPAAATHLVFVQQPVNTALGITINPAVSVKILDAYNNLVTSDNTDQVTIALASNPSGGTLSGTTKVTASSGVATFNNLSINLAGAGYTLSASSGSLTSATSASFNISSKSSSTIESFDSSPAYYVVGGGSPTAYLSTAAKHDGTYGLVDTNGNDWIYRNDSAVQVKQGDTISVWLQFSGSADGRAYFGFGASAAGTLSLIAAPNSNQFLIQNNQGYSFTNIGAVSQTWQANHWYRLEVDWGDNGGIVGKLYDSNGTTLLNTVTATTTAITSGGIAFRATGSNKYWDTVQLIPGANNLAHAANVVSSYTAALPSKMNSIAAAEIFNLKNKLASAILPPATTATSWIFTFNHFQDGNLGTMESVYGAQENQKRDFEAKISLGNQYIDWYFSLANT
jgi:hypothetical protein